MRPLAGPSATQFALAACATSGCLIGWEPYGDGVADSAGTVDDADTDVDADTDSDADTDGGGPLCAGTPPLGNFQSITDPAVGDMMTFPCGTFLYRYGSIDLPATLTYSLDVATLEVTVEQFESAMAYDATNTGGCPQCAAEVLWHHAADYLNAISVAQGLIPCFMCSGLLDQVQCEPVPDLLSCSGFRLPTDVEWEYVARSAGHNYDEFPAGGNLVDNPDDLDWTCDLSPTALDDGSVLEGQSAYRCNAEHIGDYWDPWLPLDVGGRVPSAAGVFDLAGNAIEWTVDSSSSTPTSDDTSVTDPWSPPAPSDRSRILRGGGVSSYAPAVRISSIATGATDSVSGGVRVVRTVPATMSR